MTLEDAKYYSLLMIIGEYEEFDEMMGKEVNSAGEISEVVTDLLFVSNDKSKCFDILNKFHIGKQVDDAEVAFRIIQYIKKKLELREIDRIQAIDYLRAISNAEFSNAELKKEPWITMSLLRYAKDDDGDSIIYSSDFDNFINNGTILTEDKEFEKTFQTYFEN